MFPKFLGDAPQNRTAHWQPGPETRGSASILWSCLVTLGLCVWTAVHLNIPEYDPTPKSPWYHFRWISNKPFWRKVVWLMIGMIAPEIITYISFVQRLDARALTAKVHATLALPHRSGRSPEPEVQNTPTSGIETNALARKDLPRVHSWTDMRSFYALMGGFAFDTQNLAENDKFLPGLRERATLAPAGVFWLAYHAPSLVPDISAEEVEDKNKTNALARVLTCWQAMWFFSQVILRIISKDTICLLELNTCAHVVCAVLAYAFWWDKPTGVNSPVIIRPRAPGFITEEDMYQLCAMLCFHNKFPRQREPLSRDRDWLKRVGPLRHSDAGSDILARTTNSRRNGSTGSPSTRGLTL